MYGSPFRAGEKATQTAPFSGIFQLGRVPMTSKVLLLIVVCLTWMRR
jgi:hypothetical protein